MKNCTICQLVTQKNNWPYIAFLLVIALGIALRVFQFDDWILIKGDQVRDAIAATRAFEGGPGELTLLGPRAGGTLLRLGPAFYYLQYTSAIFFGSTAPPVVAYPNLLFSVLAIGVVYLLARRYFDQLWSLVVASLFSLSFLAIEYSRFTWNPNSIPFFNLLFLYALLRIFDPDSKKLRWFVIAGISFSIATQLHFSSFLSLPLITLLFLATKRQELKTALQWKNVLVFIFIVLLFYSPVIISDIFNKGDNVKQFLSSIGTKTSNKPIFGKIWKDIYYFGKYFFRILTGYLGPQKIWHYLGIVFMLAGFGAVIKLWRQETDSRKKDFLNLFFLTLGVYFFLYVPLAYTIDKPRFFLPILAFPFFFLAFIAYTLKNYYGKAAMVVLAAVFALSNLYFTANWFWEINRSFTEKVNPKNTIVLKMKKDSAWWMWGHFKKAAGYIKKQCQGEEIYYFMSKNVREFDKSFGYALTNQGEKRLIHTFSHEIPYSEKGCYFYIYRTGDELNSKIKDNFQQNDTWKLGSLTITNFSFKDTLAKDTFYLKGTKPAEEISADIEEKEAKEGEVAEEVEELEPTLELATSEVAPGTAPVLPLRAPRIFWKDVVSYLSN